ncbi:hypothetical protein ACFYPC_36005 [Streptomyces sp. NPDC005808]|uniref:hypothetical protein n=1 Tax=Streptomyces sp. NPDC005808 TaxID=3364734 RepID=UPI0036BB76E4
MSTERPDNDATDSAEGGERDVETAKPRRRHSLVAVASVAAAVLLVGGGGAYFATTTSNGGNGDSASGTPGGDGTPPALALDGYSESGTSDTAGTDGPNGIAPGEPNPYGTTYRAEGDLADGPDSAPVYAAKGQVTKAEVARLAEALGVAGTPRTDGGDWTVGATNDAAEPNLRVSRDAPGTWTYSSYVPGSDNCVENKPCGPIGSSGLAGLRPAAVSEEAAKKAAAPVLKAVGQDDAKLDATQLMNDDRVRVVNADPEVGGLPTYGWTTGVQINSEGEVIGGSGRLKTPVKGDTYPVITAQQTLDLMNGPASGGAPKGIGGCASPVPLEDRNEVPCEVATVAPAPATATVEKATFGLAAHSVDGKQTLVPSWLFDVRSAGTEDVLTVTHPAVDPRYLTSPEAGQDPTPSPSPTGAPTTGDVKVEGYTADGKDLTVSFWGGVCSKYSASASETSDKVTVTVTSTSEPGKVCIMLAKAMDLPVHLDEPLGDRKVVGTDGKAIPEGKELGAVVSSAQPQ